MWRNSLQDEKREWEWMLCLLLALNEWMSEVKIERRMNQEEKNVTQTAFSLFRPQSQVFSSWLLLIFLSSSKHSREYNTHSYSLSITWRRLDFVIVNRSGFFHSIILLLSLSWKGRRTRDTQEDHQNLLFWRVLCFSSSSSSFSRKSIYTDFFFLSVLLEFLNCFTQLSCRRKIIDNHQLIYSLLWLFVPGLVLTEEWQTPLTWGYTRSIFFVTIFCLRHLPLFKSLLFLLPNFSTNHPNFYCLVIPGESFFNLCLSLRLQKREERLTKSLVAFFKKDCHLVTFIFFVNTFFFSWLIVKRHHGPEGKD